MRTKEWRLALAGWLVAAFAGSVAAQVLARPGWAGSGVAPESWWRAAVFYRIDPARFQASGTSKQGDLAGIAQRLDYLQTLGVDALVLDGEYQPDGLDDLIREASRHHLRLLLTVTPALQHGDRRALLQSVHEWLSAGAAGVSLPSAGPEDAVARAGYADLVSALEGVLRGFPGERVLLSEPTARDSGAGPAAGRSSRRRPAGMFNEAQAVQLTTSAVFPVQPPSAAALRQSLIAVSGNNNASGQPGLLRFAEDPPTGSPDAAAVATLLLASRGTAIFDFGDEIGLRTSAAGQATGTAALPVMQWTPVNIQQAAPAPIERAAPQPARPGETAFGSYHPYIHPPPRSLTGAAPAAPRVAIDGNIPAALPDVDTLPGFTAGSLPNPPVEGDRINVATEDRDPNSLLNAYRQLIALHHGNPALRGGTQAVLSLGSQGGQAQNAVVWVRRAPAGSRTAASVVIAVNLGTQPVTLSLDSDLAGLGMRPGAFRALFAWSGTPLTGETTGSLRLPAHAVFLGEIVHSGGAAQDVERARRVGR